MTTPAPTALAESVIDALLDLSDAVQQHFQARAADFGITPAQVHALQYLDAGRPMLMRELAARLDCGASRVTAIVDRLEDAGLVRRSAPADNRRAFQLTLTAEGDRVRRQAWQHLLAGVPATAGLSQDEQSQLGQLLAKALRQHRLR